MELQIVIGKALRAFRKQKKFTLEKMESKIGKNSSYLSRVERGVSNTTLDLIENYYQALGLSTETFLSAIITTSKHELDEEELKMMSDYSKLNKREKESVQFIISRMIIAKGKQLNSDQHDL